MSVHRRTLANGLTTILVPTGHGHAVHASVFLRVGSGCETRATNGITHFVEHLVFQGNDQFADSGELCAFVEERGGEVNAQTSPDFTQVYLTLHRDYMVEGLQALAALTFRAAVSRWEIERERTIILHERAAGGSDADAEIRQHLWPDHPLGFEVSGRHETVDGFTAAQLGDHYTQYFRPGNAVLAVAGDFQVDAAQAAVDAAFGPVPDGTGPGHGPATSEVGEPAAQRLVLDAMGGGCGVMLALPVCRFGSPDVGPLQAANFLLGGGLSSRLFLRVRERAGLAYDVGSTLAHFHDGGYFLAHAACRREQMLDCTTSLLAEVREFGEAGVTEAEIDRMRRFMHCQVDYRADDPGELAAWYGVTELLDRPETLPTPEEDAARIAGLGREELNAVLRRWFRADRATVICHSEGGWWHRRTLRRAIDDGMHHWSRG